jgi:CDP-diglyceride synthetase
MISLYFGISIQNAQDNFLVEHLYQNEGVDNYALDYIPTLSFKAALLTLVFLGVAFVLQIIIYSKSPFKRVKNLSLLAIFFFIIIFIFDILTLNYPHDYNFKDYGMIWVILSLSIVFTNMLGAFGKK